MFRRNDVADGLWGLGFIGVAAQNLISRIAPPATAILVFILVALWGLRLSVHLFNRLRQSEEDRRYAAWRKEWGRAEPVRALFQVFLLQSAVLGVVSTPVVWAIRMSAPAGSMSWTAWLGGAIFLIGFGFEAIADAELARFKRDPNNRGRILARGTWSLCRHPNYFGEILVWWGIFVIAAGVSAPASFTMIVSPITITFLLARVSGVPMLEKGLREKGAEFEEYVSKTPALFPSLQSILRGTQFRRANARPR